MANRPNILFIFPDQHRGDSLGCVGHPVVRTPNLDNIAAGGVNFTRCYTNSPLCVPARATLQTGQYVCQNGAWNNQIVADPQSPSYVRNIRDAGYKTAVIGKTHLWQHGETIGAHTNDMIQIVRDWGFEDIHELTGPMASVGHDSPYTDYLNDKGLLEPYRRYQIEYLIRNYILKRTKNIPARYKEYMEKYSVSINVDDDSPWDDPPLPLPAEDHYDSYTGQKSVDWIKAYNDDKPFFLMVGFQGPHDPFDSPEEYRAIYKPEEIPLGIMEAPEEPVPEYLKGLLNLSGLDHVTPAYMQNMMAAYYGKVSLIDDYVGRIVGALEEKGILDNTWIIYSSDHGELLGDHRLCHKMTYYEGALHIPCIIKPAGGVKAWQSTGLTDHLDLTATMLDIASAKPFEHCDGSSLVSKIATGPDDSTAQKGKEQIFSELGGNAAVFDGRFKLVAEIKTREPLQLYDLENDPQELQNLAKEESLEIIRKELLDKLESHLSSNLDEERFKVFEAGGERRF
ncbi:MAG: sulfatase-like hydrolase/transferase [Deltaproteobacteria bacterium]|nr:sulfatase-like hydrolase/transferase [Deltaproteobacteria bacterium]